MRNPRSVLTWLTVWPVVCLALACCSPRQAGGPQLIADDSVAPDLLALAQETWGQFLAVFQPRANCFGDVYLSAASGLADRAVYEPASATVTVRTPATAAMLQGALIHEWAHHIEFQCAAHKELRSAFLGAQGLPADTPWRSTEQSSTTPLGSWANIPSEQFAEATIELVLGSRRIPTPAPVRLEAVQVIRRWAASE